MYQKIDLSLRDSMRFDSIYCMVDIRNWCTKLAFVGFDSFLNLGNFRSSNHDILIFVANWFQTCLIGNGWEVWILCALNHK